MYSQASQYQYKPTAGAIVAACLCGFSFLLSVFLASELFRTVFFFGGLLLGGLFALLFWLPIIKREKAQKSTQTPITPKIERVEAIKPAEPTPVVVPPTQANPIEENSPAREESAPIKETPEIECTPAVDEQSEEQAEEQTEEQADPIVKTHTPAEVFHPTAQNETNSTDGDESVLVYEALPSEYKGTVPIAKIAIYSDEGLTPAQIKRKRELIRWREKDLISEKEFLSELEKMKNPDKRRKSSW